MADNKKDGGGRGCAIIALVIVLAVVAVVVISSVSGGSAGIGGFFADRIADLAVFAKMYPVAVVIIGIVIVGAVIGAFKGR